MGQAVVDIDEILENQEAGSFHRLLLGWSLGLMFIEGYDMQVLAFAAPLISRDWAIETGQLGSVFGAGLFGYMVGATMITQLADSLGRKPVIVWGTVLFGAFTLFSVLAGSVEQLLILRFIAGLGLGCSIPSLIALNAEYAPQHIRGLRITSLFVGYSLGGLFGGLIAAQLLPTYGWHSVFVIGGIAPILLGGIVHFKLPESIRLLAVQGRNREQILAIAQRLLPGRDLARVERFRIREHWSPGLRVRHLFSEGRGWITCLIWVTFIMSLLGHHFLTNWMPTVLERAGVPLSKAVIAGGLMMGGCAAGCLLVGWLLDRWGILAVVGLFVLSVPTVAAIGLTGLPEVWLLVMAFLAGVFLLGGQVGLNAIVGTFYPTSIRSSGTGWALGVGRIGSIAGPIIGGFLILQGTRTDALFLYAAVPAVVCSLLIGALSVLIGKHNSLAHETPAPAKAAQDI